MASHHPFQQLFETFGKLPDAHAEDVNSEARTELKDHLTAGLEKSGHCILLKAPRAGHGKTHLLTRLQHELGGTHEFLPLHATAGSRIDAATVLDDTLRRLVRPLPAAGGLTVLDLVARRLYSSALQPLVRSGEVPCQDREGALNALRTRPIETFDFHHPSAVTAHWARENFELLGPRLALELAQRNGLSLREVSFWVDAMFRFAATAIDNPGRVRALAMTVFDDPSAESVAHERLVAILGLMTSLMRVVLVADELEGFSSDETAALRFASFLGALRQSVDRLEVIVSINQDVWESAFIPRLSGGLVDRLSEIVVELEPLDREAKIAILESRSPGEGEKILSRMDSGSIPSHARGLIRQAAETWEKEENGKTEPPSAAAAVAPPQPQPAEEEPAPEPSPVAKENPVPSGTAMPDFSASAADIPKAEPEETPIQTQVRTPGAPVENDSSFESKVPADFPAPKQSEDASPEKTFQPSSWPSPEVPESSLGTSQDEAPDPAPVPDFSAPPKQEAASQIFPPAPSQPDESAEAFCSPPPEEDAPPTFQSGPIPNDPSDAFVIDTPGQPSQEAPSEEPSEASTDRVDDLLRQFRERYGKS